MDYSQLAFLEVFVRRPVVEEVVGMSHHHHHLLGAVPKQHNVVPTLHSSKRVTLLHPVDQHQEPHNYTVYVLLCHVLMVVTCLTLFILVVQINRFMVVTSPRTNGHVCEEVAVLIVVDNNQEKAAHARTHTRLCMTCLKVRRFSAYATWTERNGTIKSCLPWKNLMSQSHACM